MINSVSGVEHSLASRVSRFNVNLQLTAQAMKDLQWWIALDRGSLMVSTLLPRTPDLIIESDASNIGWGARQGEVRTGGRWSRTESSNHINHLELLAAFLAVKCFAKGKSNITIQLKLDNITAVSYINRMGGTHSQPLCNLAISVWDWSLQRGIYLIAEHLPGKLNVIADMESRTMRDRCDWMLNPNIFNRIQSQMGPCKIDLFASCLTRQLPRYYSWRPDLEAEGTDAISQDWSTTRGYANPLWCLIPRCLSQMKQQRARLVMVTPLWRTQPWFPTILGVLEDYPRLLNSQEDLIMLPTDQDFIMDQGVPELVAWPISGNPSNHEEFLLKLQTSSCPHGGQRHNQTTTLCLPDGQIGVSKGIGIPLLDL